MGALGPLRGPRGPNKEKKANQDYIYKKDYFDRTNLNSTFEDRNNTEECAKKNLESLEKEIKDTLEKSNDILSSFTDEELKNLKTSFS